MLNLKMMNKIGKIAIGIVIIVGMIGIMPGCKKYEDGPAISLKSKTKRVVNTWKLEAYYWNGIESTSSLLISGYEESYSDGGNYSRSYIDKDGDFFSESGDWEFDDKKDNLVISGVSSIELSDNNSTVTNSRVTILRLKTKELWYEFENGGDTHEFHLTSN